MALSITPFVDGVVLTAAALNTAFGSVQTYLDSTKLSLSSLQFPKSNEAISFSWLGTCASGTSKVFRFKVPAGVTYDWTDFQLSFSTVVSGTPTLTATITDDGVTVPASTFSTGTAATVASTTNFTVTSSGAGSVIVVTLTVSGGTDITDATIVLHCKSNHRS